MPNSQIFKSALISYIAIFFNIVAGLIYTPWMIKQIGVSDYGLYTLVFAFLSYFLMDFGIGQALARFIAIYKSEGNTKKINEFFGVSISIYLIIDVLIFIILCIVFIFLENIFLELTEQEQHKFKIVYVIAGFFSIVTFPLAPIRGVLIAHERFVFLKLSDLLQKVMVVLLMVLALSLGYGLYIMIIINGFVGLVVKAYGFYEIRKTVNFRINISNIDFKIVKELFSFSMWVFIIGIAQRLILNIMPTLLGVYSGTQAIAIFSVAMILEGHTWTFAQALNGLFLPKLTKMVVLNESRVKITNLMIKVGRIQYLIIGLLITGLIVLGKPFISLWMGNAFSESYFVVLLLVLPGLITLTQEIASTLLFVINELKYRAVLYSLAGAISVIFGVFLIPGYGAVGSAIGVFIAIVLCHIIGINIVYSRVLKLDIKRFFRSVHMQISWPLIVSGVLSFIGQQYYQINSWSSLLISGSAFVLIYVLLVWNLTMNKDERLLILKVVNKITRRK